MKPSDCGHFTSERPAIARTMKTKTAQELITDIAIDKALAETNERILALVAVLRREFDLAIKSEHYGNSMQSAKSCSMVDQAIDALESLTQTKS